ncbi:DUF5340 domain-containing protein [Leptolyngbyaceae cyanobacterium UHCC 1019]
MEPIPLPSHVHYELLLQLLERQTMLAVEQKPGLHDQVQQLIITMRKAISQQKRLEEACERYQLPIDYRWSLNTPAQTAAQTERVSKDFLSLHPE